MSGNKILQEIYIIYIYVVRASKSEAERKCGAICDSNKSGQIIQILCTILATLPINLKVIQNRKKLIT